MLLYIHVPFCRRRCRYCAFYSTVAAGGVPEAYVDALRAEMGLWAGRLADGGLGTDVETIFLGGGTPSLLTPAQAGSILERAAACFSIAPGAEISIEGNPDSLRLPGRLRGLRAAGFTRLSMGAQSFNDAELALLGRPHTAADIAAAVDAARGAGFDNIGLDLIWGLPGQTPEGWQATLRGALDLTPDHVSAYALTLEEGTLLARMAEYGQTPPLPAEEDARRMYLEGAATLEAAGLGQYEISNFAREGHRCRHNMGYWLGEDYLGIGPSAVSTVAGCRWDDAADLAIWADDVRASRVAARARELDAGTRLRETVMLRLRTTDGLPRDVFAAAAAEAGLPGEPGPATRGFVGALCAAGLATTGGGRMALTTEGLLVSDAVIAEFFLRLDEAAGTAAAVARDGMEPERPGADGDDLE